MKILLIILFTSLTYAQTDKLKVSTDLSEGDTIISVKKGEHAKKNLNCEKQFEIVDGRADIQGDAALMINEARAKWKKSCEDWKSETKSLNADNKVIVLNCNSPSCLKDSAQNGDYICRSSGVYKIKIRLSE